MHLVEQTLVKKPVPGYHEYRYPIAGPIEGITDKQETKPALMHSLWDAASDEEVPEPLPQVKK